MSEKPNNAKAKLAERSSQLEEQIREQARRKEERQFLEELAKRISIAREGKVLMEKGAYPAAMTSYRRFLMLSARAWKVEVAELSPNLYDEKTRTSECILLTAIFLDLMKMLDLLDTPAAKEERDLYRKLFVRFTVGQPFQSFAAENLRKFISYSGGLRHKNEFNAMYKAIKIKKLCFVASWAFENPEAVEVMALRKFRDEILNQSLFGKILVSVYYKVAPGLVFLFSHIPGSKPFVRKTLQNLVSHLPE